MGSTPRRHHSSSITTTSRRPVATARPWPVHPRGSNGDATRVNKLRAVTSVSLDTLPEPQGPAFAAADAVARALRDVGRDAIGVVGKQAAPVADWLRQNGRDAHVLPRPGKEEPGEAWVAIETTLGNRRPRLHRARLAQWKRIERPQADAATRWAADRRGAECHSCQCPAGDAAWAAPCVHRRFRRRAASP